MQSNLIFYQTAYEQSLCRHFSIAFDLYLAILAGIDANVKCALGRDDPNWEFLHNCPPCMNELEMEEPLKFSMLWSTDGNESLSRLDRREPPAEKGMLGASVESFDSRTVRGNIYLPREDVDRWADKSGPKGREVVSSITVSIMCQH